MNLSVRMESPVCVCRFPRVLKTRSIRRTNVQRSLILARSSAAQFMNTQLLRRSFGYSFRSLALAGILSAANASDASAASATSIRLYAVNYFTVRGQLEAPSNEVHALISHVVFGLVFSGVYRAVSVPTVKELETRHARHAIKN